MDIYEKLPKQIVNGLEWRKQLIEDTVDSTQKSAILQTMGYIGALIDMELISSEEYDELYDYIFGKEEGGEKNEG